MNHIFKTCNSTPIKFLINGWKTSRNTSNISKDIVKQNSDPTKFTDLLISNLRSAKSISGVLELVNSHNNVMNPNHTLQALKTIFTLQRNSNSAIPTSQILNHPDFEKICNQLKYYAGAIELSDVIEALKVITFVGVSSESTIYQILLQLLKHSVNQLSLQQIIFLDFLLSKAKPSPLVDALQIALPIVYDIQLPIKLDQSNLTSLPEHLHYVSKKNVSDQSVEIIVNSLMKAKMFNVKNSVSIIWSICDMKPNVFFEPLFNKALKSLLAVSDSIPYADLETIISKMISRYNWKTPFYYNEKFFDYCADTLISQDLGFENAVHLFRKLLRVGHMHKGLLDYISEKCYQNSELIENGDPILTYYVMYGCAFTEFKPKYYNAIKESFLKTSTRDSTQNDLLLMKLQTSLAVLDIYIPEIIEKALSEDLLQKVIKKGHSADLENILLITQAIRTFKPEFNKYLPSDELLQTVKAKIRPISDYPLEGSLQHVFGGEKFVKTPAITKILHHIDHLILLKRGGFASVLNPSDAYVENVACESPNQIVLVLALKSNHYTINNRYPLGSTILMIRTLEAKGYSVVPVCVAVWKSLPDYEKLPYLMEAIKSKTEYFDRVYDIS